MTYANVVATLALFLALGGSGSCGAGYTVLVTTYSGAGGSPTNEQWYGFFY